MNAEPQDLAPELPPLAVLVVALAQGLGLYGLMELGKADFFDLTAAPWLSACIALLVFAPPVIYLMGRRLRQGGGLLLTALLLAAVAALAAYGGYQTSALALFDTDGALAAQTWLGIFLLVKLSLPFLQTLLDAKAGRAASALDYASLFRNAWYNTVTVIEGAVFTGIVWLILALWMGLFSILDISIIKDVITEASVVIPLTTVAFGQGVYLVQRHKRYIQAMLSPILGSLAFLLPLALLVVASFLAMLPFTGLTPIWNTGHAGILLILAAALLILFFNAAYGDGHAAQAPYPVTVSRLVRLLVWAIPALAALAGWALYLRVEQYGWTVERIQAAVITVIIGYYGLGYALSGLRSKRWFAGIAQVNILGAWLVLGTTVVLLSPLAYSGKLAVADQLARLEKGLTTPEEIDTRFLRFDTGRAGVTVLQTWAAEEGNTLLAKRADEALSSENRWSLTQAQETPLEEQLPTMLQGLGEEEPALSDEQISALAQWIQQEQGDFSRICLRDEENFAPCKILYGNLDDDAENELLLLPLFDSQTPYLRFTEGQWQVDGTAIQDLFALPSHSEDKQHHLSRQTFTVLEANGQHYLLTPNRP